MSNALTPIITNQGRQALMSGFSTPNNYRFSHVALGDANGAGYIANSTEETLKNELQRVDIENVIVQDSNRLHITAVAGLPKDGESADAYEVHEIGFFLEPIDTEGKATGDPMLFAIYATKPGNREKALLTKEPDTELLLAFDLLLPELGESDFDFNKDSYLHLTRASQNTLGIVQMATESEILAGEKDNLAISPLGLHTVLKQAVESSFADDEQTLAGESSLLAVTPAGLKHTLTSQFADIDEAIAGESSSLAVTPAGLKQALTSQLATNEEAMSGEAEDKAVTPSGLKSVLKNEAVSFPVMEAALLNNLATAAEAVAGLAGDKAVTPLGLQAKIDEIDKTYASEMEAVILNNLATIEEAVAGTASDKAVTPVGLQAKFAEIEKQGSSDVVQDLSVNGSVNFGASVRQMLNLWNAQYGIGVQNATQYYRTGNNFAWYKNGVHTAETFNPGKGGRLDMVLKDGKLGIGTADPGPESQLKVAKSESDFAHFRFPKNTGGGELEFVNWTSGWNINVKTAGKHLYINRDTKADTFIGRANNEVVIKGEDGSVLIKKDATINGKLLVGDTDVLKAINAIQTGGKEGLSNIVQDLTIKGSVSLGGFTKKETDEWPIVTWCRDLNKKWDEGLIKYTKGRGMFGRPGFGIHFHESREWNFFSTNWDALLGIEGKTGNTKIKGNLTVGGAITPSAGNKEANGIMFPKNPFGGGGDAAWIRYYTRSGEATTFEIGTSNDANDHIALMASGHVGVGTNAPEATLSIANKGGKERDPDANMHITANCILFGGNNSGKQTDSAQISAGKHAANSLNIVGMSSKTDYTTRKIDMWAEGGLTIRGPVNITEEIQQEKWKAPKLAGGWKNYGGAYNPCGYYKDTLGVVHLRGLIKSGTASRDKPIFTVPAGYRPEFRYLTNGTSEGNLCPRVDITADGKVLLVEAHKNWVSLDNISFRVKGV